MAKNFKNLVEEDLQLEAGKVYLSRAGEVVTIKERPDYHPFMGIENGASYTLSGRFYGSYLPCEQDLVQPVEGNLQLEAGQQYVSRSGQVVTVEARSEFHQAYPFIGIESGDTFTSSGHFFNSDSPCEQDLVMLVGKSLELEVGKAYVTRGGEVVTIKERPEKYPFMGIENGETYTSTGRTYVCCDDYDDCTSYLDIVAEYVAEQDDSISKDESELRLGVGKVYNTRDGRQVTIVFRPTALQYPFLGIENNISYDSMGRQRGYREGEEHEDDLVGEAEIPTYGVKFDTGKADLTLLPQAGLLSAAQVMTQAQSKYPVKDNWKSLENGAQRTIAASLRHINQHLQGNVIDKESGMLHLAHAAVDILMALELFEVEHFESRG